MVTSVTLLHQRQARDYVLMQHASVAHDLRVASCDLAAHGRKLSVHLLAKLRNLPGELLDPRRKLFESRHSVFQPFYPADKSLRLHRPSNKEPETRAMRRPQSKGRCQRRAAHETTTVASSQRMRQEESEAFYFLWRVMPLEMRNIRPE